MPKSLTTKKIITINKPSTIESLYLRLYTHNYTSAKMSLILEQNSNGISSIRNNIRRKYKSKDWLKIIQLAIKNNHLNKVDFLEDIVKQEASIYSQLILNSYIDNTKKTDKALKDVLQEYYNNCELKINKNYKKEGLKDKLTSIEIALIKLKFNGESIENIAKVLNITENKFKQYKTQIFKKLEANNWFNIYKKGLQTNIIDKPLTYYVELDENISNSLNKLNEISKQDTLNDKEKELAVYDNLLDLYTTIEFKNLFNNIKDEELGLEQKV